jgi:signal transduction histidine kinase
MTQRSLRSRLTTFLLIWGAFLIGFLVLAGAMHLSLLTRWRLHLAFPILSGLLFVGFGVMVVRRGLSPFRIMRERLADVRQGRSARLVGEYPSEVSPLVHDLNALLDEREHRVARAVAKAGDLAHGLKTPLAVLTQEIERADASGQHEVAESMRQQVTRMQRQIDSHLAQARVTAAGTASQARANVADAAGALVRAMERLHASRTLKIEVAVPSDQIVRVVFEDVEEMLGNLLDNACKWARSRVRISSDVVDAERLAINVDDDGPGLDESLHEHVLRRGVRADEATPGSGLGLSIVRDLADAYGGSIVLTRSPLGGLRAQLTLRR